MELIRLDDVDFAYGDAGVLRSLTLVVSDQEVTVLVGPSGSGKTTVLRLIAGFEAPQRGRVIMNGEVVAENGRILLPPEARGVSMVFQELALWPHMSILDTLEFVLGSRLDGHERRRRIEETLRAVGLERYVNTRPAQLSGGERQRLAIARAIVTQPRILLMDEPLANLDPPLRQALLEEIRRLQQRLGLAILYVTHNQQETFMLGDRAAVIRDGRIEQTGSPLDLYDHPQTAFVASLLGRCALLSGRRHDSRVETVLGPLPAVEPGATAEREVVVVIRPEDVSVDDDGPFCGRVERVKSLGGCFETEIAGPGWRIWAMMREPPTVGIALRFAVRKTAVAAA
jgi:iron(III) transport system ATP-binding protein